MTATDCRWIGPYGVSRSSSPDTGRHCAEVDYVAAFDGRIVPIEVKAGASGALKSLHQFAAEKEVCPTEATIWSSSLDIAAISSADPMVTRRQSASP